MKKILSSRNVRTALLSLFFLMLITGLVLYKVIFIFNTEIFSSFWLLYGTIVSIFLISRVPYSFLYTDNHEKQYTDSEYPSVSVVIAAKNEEEGIFETIESCVKSRYPGEIECIIINDGSTDNTEKEILRSQKIYGSTVIKLISFPKNHGKREAMAVGIENAKNEIIVFVDSDSFLEEGAIKHITEHFIGHKNIGAVAGNTEVRNANKNFLTKMQSVQYAISFGIYKASESVHSCVTCCPGCFSAYRRESIKDLVHGWLHQRFLGIKGTFGDDRSLTNFVLKNGWQVIYCEKAKAETVVPEKFKQYWRQQLRWKKSWLREGLLASIFMWKKNPLASLAFYINFSFPFLGPVLAVYMLVNSIITRNPLLFLLFIFGFVLIGLVFSLFVRVYHGLEHWFYMPLFSILFVTVFIWQMPIAALTVRNHRWGTR